MPTSLSLALRGALFLSALTLGAAAHASCGAAFCVLNTSWDTQGVQTQPGQATLDLRYEYVRQSRLWQGSSKADREPADADAKELRTLNRNLVGTLDYTFNQRWGVAVALPLVSRRHDHVADPAGAATPESWSFARSGDMRVLGRYQLNGAGEPDSHGSPYGLQFGLKLPTGDTKVTNSDGTLAERALQPGSGSTDVILGGYYSHRPMMSGPTWFVQGLWQHAVATRDDYRPGDTLSASVGVSYPQGDAFSWLFQLNGLIKRRDTGLNAEPDLSGSRTLFASPGAAYHLSPDVQVYAYVQAPLYRHVNGTQLTANASLVGGLSLRF